MMGQFVHLRMRSAYSLLDGASHVKDLVKIAKASGQFALGISDPNLFGALEFSETSADNGIQPIMGLALPVQLRPAALGGHQEADGHLALIAQNETGWKQLMALSSQCFLIPEGAQTAAGFVSLEDVLAHADGVICLTGGTEGPLSNVLLSGDIEAAGAYLDQMAHAFGDRLYVEIQRHEPAKEAILEQALVSLAYGKNVPLVATNDVRYGAAEKAPLQRVLECIRTGEKLGDTGTRQKQAAHWLKPAEDMLALFADLPEASENTIEIARRCAVRPLPKKPILPRYVVRGEGGNEQNEQARDEESQKVFEIDQLKIQAEAGLEERLIRREKVADEKIYRDRLSFELGVIANMGFAGYFLIVADFIKWAKANDVPVGPGRGSGAGSLVAYALTITDLDPLRFGLLFERFLNPERVSMPDFDIDFCQDKRERVIAYVQETYGRDRVAQIITFGSLQARAAVRDVGRVMNMSYGHVDSIAKLIPNNPAAPVPLREALGKGEFVLSERRERMLMDRYERNEEEKDLLDAAMGIEGLFRNASTHAAGVVMADRPLVELVPLYQDPRSELPATQWNMKWAEIGGLVKFDFLGLKTLTVIDRALGFLKLENIEVDFDRLPFDDRATYALLRTGETAGVFQLESQGMRDTLRKMRANTLDDIIALISLYRPGPMAYIEEYCNVKHGRASADYMHELLEPILRETQGVIVYQEQVMQIAQILSGYSLGEADLLRRAMGKKKPEEMAQQKKRFMDGAKEKGVEPNLAAAIFDKVEMFAGYGFNKSHAAAYAVIAYQTAWLKANHPVAFMAATMSLDIHDTDKLSSLVQEVRRMGIKILPPDINKSSADFTVENGAIRYGLGAVKTVGLAAMDQLCQARPKGGFTSLYDVFERVPAGILNKRSVETLAKAGAFDGIDANRALVFECAEMLIQHGALANADKASDQGSLFGEASPPPRAPLPATMTWPNSERLPREFEALGLYLSGHPLSDMVDTLKERKILFKAGLLAAAGQGDTTARMAGLLRSKKERPGKRGDRLGWLTISDPTGDYEVMILPEHLERAREQGLLEPGQLLCLQVTARRTEDDVRLLGQNLTGLDSERVARCDGLKVYLGPYGDVGHIAEIASVLAGKEAKDFGALHLVLRLNDGSEVEIATRGQIPVDIQARRALKDGRGVELVEAF